MGARHSASYLDFSHCLPFHRPQDFSLLIGLLTGGHYGEQGFQRVLITLECRH